MDGWALSLDLDCEDGKEDDLHSRARRIPEGPRYTELVGNVGGLEEGGCPGPLRHDVRGSQASRDRAAGRRESLRVVAGLLVVRDVLVRKPHHAGSEACKDGADAEHDEPSEALREGGRAAEKIALAVVGLAQVVLEAEHVLVCRPAIDASGIRENAGLGLQHFLRRRLSVRAYMRERCDDACRDRDGRRPEGCTGMASTRLSVAEQGLTIAIGMRHSIPSCTPSVGAMGTRLGFAMCAGWVQRICDPPSVYIGILGVYLRVHLPPATRNGYEFGAFSSTESTDLFQKRIFAH